ncbi:MAG: cyclopropane-fatty-acyl-phospholipid synthase family protein [Pseudoruegeria sp.]
MDIRTSLKGEVNLPRYFRQVFEVLSQAQRGCVDIILPDGRHFRMEASESGPIAHVDVHQDDVFARLIREGDLGFSEAYMDGSWTTPDLQAFMDYVYLAGDRMFSKFPGLGLLRAYERMRFWLQSNSKSQAKKNISYHYDLGNEFYGLWLDETMTYSSALYENGQEELSEAQILKYKQIVDSIGLVEGQHVLEIGCGWGGFAEYAAGSRGIKVTGLTISKEQYDFAVARMARLGLSDLVTIKLQDYRDETGVYDGIASIEMFEAVGEKYWPIYFEAIRNRLKPGAHATLQIITVADDRFHNYKEGVDFIQKYIFPGGMLPSPTVLRDQVEMAGLTVQGSYEFGESYSVTLRRWHDVFNARWHSIRELGFDERFRRMWNFYLTSCAATFHSGNCDVTQITIKNSS